MFAMPESERSVLAGSGRPAAENAAAAREAMVTPSFRHPRGKSRTCVGMRVAIHGDR